MMHLKKIILPLVFMFVLLSIFLLVKSFSPTTNEESGQLSVEGIVGKISGEQLLIEQGLSSEEVMKLSEREILLNSKSATYFTLPESEEKLAVGNKVKVWYENLDTSNPARGTATKIAILEN
ncbi:DUF3221 domain-containing protein [Bacillus sp. SCS-153A]|uniref:DUF3221 domain-containing protein n=1 Tax=Rossellomorea sedimentorum TaxID=3115294 RepID=UPI0039057E95